MKEKSIGEITMRKAWRDVLYVLLSVACVVGGGMGAYAVQDQALGYGAGEDFLFGDDIYADEQIGQLSSANKALFIDDNLRNIVEPSDIHYHFAHHSVFGDDYAGTVTVKVNRVRENGRKDLVFRYLQGRHRVRFQPRYNMKTNPLFMLFLESDVREMKRVTGGSSLFFRSRLRHSLARAEAEDYTFRHLGEDIRGKRIIIRPYAEFAKDDREMIERFGNFLYKTYEFVLSESIPGGIYRLRSVVPEAGERSDRYKIDDMLVYRGWESHGEREGDGI
ncbi:MAG: hypothetical protein GDA54_01205 [Alphaproteobacteria bacterium GM7ARS4]|nr:hypothetical protein [Alphaproteobacteria bacterium GM7ARS4]